MGIHLNLAVLLGEMARRHQISGRVATLGEQSLSFDPDRDLPPLAGAGASLSAGAARRPAARLFARFGFASVESIDIEASEGATYLFDLNHHDLPAVMAGNFDLVFNGGTIEHVFHLPNALANISRMLRDGGVVMHVLPCHNWVDHGYYQFSPCLMFDYYRAAGFECLESMLLGYAADEPDRWIVRCAPPGLFGAGLAGVLGDSIYLQLFAARRTGNIELYPVPVQALYAAADRIDDWARDRPRWFLPFALHGGRRKAPSHCTELVLPATSLSPESGHLWSAPVPGFSGLADTLERPAASSLVLLEDGVPLGPAHAAHTEIGARGRGRYSHWGERLYFASSDNSPPNANGRRYEIVIPTFAQPRRQMDRDTGWGLP